MFRLIRKACYHLKKLNFLVFTMSAHVKKSLLWSFGITAILTVFSPFWFTNEYYFIHGSPDDFSLDGKKPQDFFMVFCASFLLIFFVFYKNINEKTMRSSIILGLLAGLVSSILGEMWAWTISGTSFWIFALMVFSESIARLGWLAGALFGCLNRVSNKYFSE